MTSAPTPEQASQTRDLYLCQMEGEQATFLNIVRAMPDADLGHKPEERLMSFAELARHVAESGTFFGNTIAAGKADMGGERETPPPPASSEALADEIGATFQRTLERFRAFSAEDLARPIDFFGMGEFPGVMFINWDMSHLIHHRAQMGLYLRLAGHKVPSVYGPTLDQSFEDMMAKGC